MQSNISYELYCNLYFVLRFSGGIFPQTVWSITIVPAKSNTTNQPHPYSSFC